MANLTCPHCGFHVEAEQIYCPNCTRSLRLTVQEPVSENARTQGARSIGWVVALGVIGVCALAAVPMLIIPAARMGSAARPGTSTPAQQTACMSNIKQLTLGALIYQSDYDDRNFPTLAFQPVLMPYIKNNTVFRCPTTSAPYAANPNLLKLEAKKIKDPTTTVFFFEGSAKLLATPHSGTGNVGFADGHVKPFTTAGMTSVKWNP